MKEIIDSLPIKLLLAVCTVAGAYLTIDSDIVRLILIASTISIVFYLIKKKDQSVENAENSDKNNNDNNTLYPENLGDFGSLLRKFNRYNISSLDVLDEEKIKEYIYPILSGRPVAKE